MGRDDNGGLHTDGDEIVIGIADEDGGGRTTQGRGGYLDGQGGDPVGDTTSDTGPGTTR